MILRKTKAITRRPFAVLDIGSSKICCMIGEADGSGGVRLLGYGTHASSGIRAGEVSDLDALSGAIGKTVQSAEREAAYQSSLPALWCPVADLFLAFITKA